MAEQHSTIIEFPRGKYDPRRDKAEYFYPRFRARLRELVVLFGIGSVVRTERRIAAASKNSKDSLTALLPSVSGRIPMLDDTAVWALD
jgi:hypothetical protein